MPLEQDDKTVLFRDLLARCAELYNSSAELCVLSYPQALEARGEEGFIESMNNLHKALAVKVFVSVCEADRHWSRDEQLLAQVLLDHLWAKSLEGEKLREAILDMSDRSTKLSWYSLVRPFDEIPPLRDRVGDLETIVIRMANLVARADGRIGAAESNVIGSIQDELMLHLRPIPIDQPDQHAVAEEATRSAIDEVLGSAKGLPRETDTKTTASATDEQKPVQESLEGVLDELEQLTGLQAVKGEVRTLTNFLKVQTKREHAGLPTTSVSLHTVFVGNPGTGKTTVARIVGRVLGAMGVLSKGHLVETDRSGLVAEYAGQTGPKTNEKINEALDGVLFIDEAYTLISGDGDDPFGHEAVQALLKRMEDDRDRLVVILAGYPDQMGRLLKSNPGLGSRFHRRIEFADYSPLELVQILGSLCAKNHYKLPPLTRAKAIVGMTALHAARNAHFGNGRSVRNLFERAIRRMADRVARLPDLSVEQLTTLVEDDLDFKGVDNAVFEELAEDGPHRFRLSCPECENSSRAPAGFLGRSVRCPKCQKTFRAEWGPLVDTDQTPV